MAEELAVENGRISHFQGLMTLTLTMGWVIRADTAYRRASLVDFYLHANIFH